MGANGFSIREYTYKMRSVDVFKCWPFSTTPSVTSQDLQSWLPPMTPLPSSNHLQSLRSTTNTTTNINQPSLPESSRTFSGESRSDDDSVPLSPPPPPPAADDEKLEMVCPVCREFNAATLTAVNAHIDGCLAQSVRDERRNHARVMSATTTTTTSTFKSTSSSKSKAPKKRSIAEIFKVKEVEEVEKQKEKEKEEEEEEEEKEEEEEEEEPQRIESVLKLWKDGGGDESIVDEVSNTVTKFRWLSRRLEALRSGRCGGQSAKSDGGGGSAATAEEDGEKSEMVCPVCRDFNAATVTAVNAHIDSCLAQAVRDERRQMRRTTGGGCGGSGSKPKPKAPKKRSIAEILNVAPPIGATKSKSIEVAKDDDEEEYNEDEEQSDYSALESARAADADVVSTIKSKKSSASSKSSKKKNKKTKKSKKRSKLEKHGDSGVSLNNEKKKTTMSKKKKKKKSFFNNEVISTKEDVCKRKVQTPVYSSRKLKGTIGNKMVALHDIDPSIYEKKSGSKILFIEKKEKVKNCDPVGKQQKAVSPVRGILKNHFKQVSGKTSSGSSTQDGTDEWHSDDEFQMSDRHVRFAGKHDVLLRPKKRNSFDKTMFNKSSDVMATSLVKEQSSGSDEDTASFEENRNYDYIATNIDKRKEVCTIVESKQFYNTLEQSTAQNFLNPCTNEEKSMHFEEKSETLTEVEFCDNNNLQPFDGGDCLKPCTDREKSETKVAFCDNSNLQPFDGGSATTFHCSSYDDISGPLSPVQEVKMSGTNAQVCESGSLSSIGKFIDHLEDPSFRAVPVNSSGDTRTFLEPSPSYSASYNKANGRPEFPLRTYGDNDTSSQTLGDRSMSQMFAADMIDNSFQYTCWGKGNVRNNCLDPSFFGLPLNSHGGLISFSSSGKIGMNQLETSSTLRGSLSGVPVDNICHQGSQENSSINERHVVQNPYPHYPARLAVTELPCIEREDIHRPTSDTRSSPYSQPLNSEMNNMRSSFIDQNQHDQVQNIKGNGVVSRKESSDHVTLNSSQPTMRLMGKDVPIGSSSKAMQHFAGDVWTDEQSRRRHYSEYDSLENSLLGRCSKQDWESGSSLQTSTDNAMQSAKVRSNQALPGTLLTNGPDAEFPQRFTDLQSNHASQNGSLPVSRNTSSYFHPISQEPASCTAFNEAPDGFLEGYIAGAKPLGLSSQSGIAATPCDFSQRACLSNGELNDRNKNPHVPKSAFEFPFLQTAAVDEQAKASWFQRSYRSLPSWLSGSKDGRQPVSFSQQFSGASNQSFPQNVWGSKFTVPHANHSTKVLYPSNPLTSPGPMKTTPLCPASIVQPLHAPVAYSTINGGGRNMNKVAERVKLDDMISKDHHHPCTNTRKRPAASALDDSRKPVKLPHTEVQENSSRHTTRLTGENSSSELQRNARAVQLDPHVDIGRSRCCQNEAQKLNPTSYPAVDSFKLDGAVTSGPVRLGPRSKHILRSS